MGAQARGGSNEEGWSNASAAGENTNKADRETKLGGTSVYTAQEDDRGRAAFSKLHGADRKSVV